MPIKTTGWQTRRATSADHAAILEINAEGVPGVSPLDADKLDRLAAAADPVLVASRAGEVGGFLVALPPGADYDGACYRWFSAHQPGSLYIDRVAIGSAWRRTGAASALYRAAEEAARRQGLALLSCEVNLDPPNPVSMAFHREHGFRDVGELALPDGRRVSLMVRSPDHSGP